MGFRVFGWIVYWTGQCNGLNDTMGWCNGQDGALGLTGRCIEFDCILDKTMYWVIECFGLDDVILDWTMYWV